MTIHVGLGSGGETHLVGDRELYNSAAELSRIMGYRNPDQFFCDPAAIDPRTGQLLHPPTPPRRSSSNLQELSRICRCKLNTAMRA